MGKVLVNGHAEMEVAPDRCDITLTVETEGTTAAKASTSATNELEKLLARLTEIGIQPENMTVVEDESEKPFRRGEDRYTSKRSVCIHSVVNPALVNRIHDIIGAGFENTTMEVEYDISSREEKMRTLTRQAIQESRKTADLLAEATGTKVVGIKAANLSGTDMNLDIADLDMSGTDHPALDRRLLCFSSQYAVGSATPISDQLMPEKLKLNADVRIVWMLE